MNRKELKEKHRELSDKEPFTDKESKQFNKKDMSMIRNIQILNNFNKKDAINLLKNYKGSSKQALSNLAKAYRKRLTKGYPKNKPEVRGRVTEHRKKQPARVKANIKKNREEVNKYLNNPKNRNKANYKKIEKGHKKYLDASEYELRYGVNSKKSQAYRERIGLSKKYEGRIVK